jgi:uncharacterized protein YjdB
MAAVPAVTVTADQPEYVTGQTVTLTFSVPADTRDQVTPRSIVWQGRDGEGNVVDGTLQVNVHVTVPDTFLLDFVRWEDTGAGFAVSGLTATGTA